MSTNFELQNFYTLITGNVTQLLEEATDGMFREAAFFQTVTAYFEDAEETANCQICTSVHRNRAHNRMRQINGYAIWDDYETLDLFVADFQNEGIRYLDKAVITSLLNLGYKYYKYLRSGGSAQAEESAAGQELLSNYTEFGANILRLRVILITDGLIRNDYSLPKTQQEGDVLFEVWDLQRIWEVWSSGGEREQIEIDLPAQFGCKLPFLKANQEADQYAAYVTIVPAALLADLYHTYGTRLLEQNVRVYLQNLGKVNRDIRKTILTSPGMFMAYNNGISATAGRVSFDTDPRTGQSYIRLLSNLQIVNGGQTTSSIFYARKKDRADLSLINVQVKITCIGDEQGAEEVVTKISKFANSQNKVSEIDLTSNQPFQIRLEELSRTTWAASTGRSGQYTRWFYERVKGQYKEELNKELTASRKNIFKAKNPPGQVLRKEELAKYRNCWNRLPYVVARGSQKNYLQFIGEENRLSPDRDYFRDTAAVAILFKAAEKIYGKKPDSMGDLRYLVVPYTIAWLNHHTGQRLDLRKIWSAQDISLPMQRLLKAALLKINAFFQEEKPDAFALISEWAKREECWDMLVAETPEDYGIDLTVIAGDLGDVSQKAAPANISGLNPGLSIAQWEILEVTGRERQQLDLFQLNVIRNVIRRLKSGKPLGGQLEIDAAELFGKYSGMVATE